MDKITAFTRSEALRKQVLSGKMASDNQRILEFAMSTNGFILPTLKIRLGMEKVSTVNARVSDLQDMGLLQAKGWAYNNDQKHSIFVFVANIEKRKELIAKRHKERADRWIKAGKEFEDYFTVTKKNANLDGQTKLF